MKQFSMWAVLAFAVFLIGKSAQSANEQMSNVLLKNVDALALGDDSEEYIRCYGSGSVNCNGYYVAYKLFDANGWGDDHETE